MSSLREAIAQAIRDTTVPKGTSMADYALAQADAVLGVVEASLREQPQSDDGLWDKAWAAGYGRGRQAREAYLREHDRELLQAFLDNGVYAVRWKAEERERARQRIEALREAALAVEPKTAGHALELGGYVQGFSDALEALGGSE